MPEEFLKQDSATEERPPAEGPGSEEPEVARPPRLREIFRQALEKARREPQPAASQRSCCSFLACSRLPIRRKIELVRSAPALRTWDGERLRASRPQTKWVQSHR